MSKPYVEKSTTEEFAIGLVWHTPDLAEGETISVLAVSVSPSGLTTSNNTIDGNTTSTRIAGGTTKTKYTVEFKITTSANNIFEREYFVYVK